jgi:response regulator NasT
MLDSLGFAEILESVDADAALVLALDRLPELAIFDIAAQGNDCLNSVNAIRERLKIPVIFLGNGFSGELLEKAISAGVGGFLAKPVREEELWPAIELASVHTHELEDLREKVAALEGALESRKYVEKAKGVLMRAHGLSEPEAFRRMQKLAMDKRKSLRQIAEAILLTNGA